MQCPRPPPRRSREQLRLGRGYVLRKTLQEQAEFDAEVIEAGAQEDYFRALADAWIAWRSADGGFAV